jgi:phage N-6-adenine-methyltransferase
VRPVDPKKGVWPTPGSLFDPLNRRHRFDLDVCASKSNAKCPRYFTEEQDAMRHLWHCRCGFINWPYGLPAPHSNEDWAARARQQVELGIAKRLCALVPVKAETAWYQDLVWGDNRVIASRKVPDGPFAGRWYRLRESLWDVEVLELRSRISFGEGAGFFASALVFYNAPARPALLELS